VVIAMIWPELARLQLVLTHLICRGLHRERERWTNVRDLFCRRGWTTSAALSRSGDGHSSAETTDHVGCPCLVVYDCVGLFK